MARSRAMVAELERRPPHGLTEFVPAFTTLLVEFDRSSVPEPAKFAGELLARFASLEHVAPPLPPIREIPVIYDGPDLAALARAKQLSIDEVCRLHAAPIYHVCMLGFAPGFPYLCELDPRLHAPRLASPRPLVPAGSVAIGGEHTGIYTVDSPGGWHIIGRTTVKVFDPERGPPHGPDEAMFALRQGDRVKFAPPTGSGGAR